MHQWMRDIPINCFHSAEVCMSAWNNERIYAETGRKMKSVSVVISTWWPMEPLPDSPSTPTAMAYSWICSSAFIPAATCRENTGRWETVYVNLKGYRKETFKGYHMYMWYHDSEMHYLMMINGGGRAKTPGIPLKTTSGLDSEMATCIQSLTDTHCSLQVTIFSMHATDSEITSLYALYTWDIRCYINEQSKMLNK